MHENGIRKPIYICLLFCPPPPILLSVYPPPPPLDMQCMRVAFPIARIGEKERERRVKKNGSGRRRRGDGAYSLTLYAWLTCHLPWYNDTHRHFYLIHSLTILNILLCTSSLCENMLCYVSSISVVILVLLCPSSSLFLPPRAKDLP